jgi:hypothetical protein
MGYANKYLLSGGVSQLTSKSPCRQVKNTGRYQKKVAGTPADH